MNVKAKFCKKVFVLPLCASLCLTPFFPVNAQDGTNHAEEIKNGDVILLGETDDSIGFTGEWLVLDAAHTNTGETGMFLLSKDLIGSDTETGMLYKDIGDEIVVTFDDRGDSYAAEHPDVLDYQGSNIRRWCADFLTSHFSETEQNALIKTYKSDDAYQSPIMFNGQNTSVNFDAAENILNGDQLFLLSAQEASNPVYGFTDDESRIAALNGQDAMWWLRSPHTPTYPLDVGMVFTTGSIMDFPVNAQVGFSVKFVTCARPACNLDIEKIVDAKAAGQTKEGATIWELTLEDAENTPAENIENSNPANSNPSTAQSEDSTASNTNVTILLSFLAAAVLAIVAVLVLRKKKH